MGLGRGSAITLAVVFFAACGRQGGTNSTAENPASSEIAESIRPDTVTLDLSSPDRALQSYWRLQDAQSAWNDRITKRLFAKIANDIKAQRHRKDSLLTGRALAYERSFRDDDAPVRLTVYEREILKVTQETATRAVAEVRIKDVTPLRPYETVSEYRKTHRDPGVLFRYVLELHGQAWKIVDVFAEKDYDKGVWESQWAKGRDTTAYYPLVSP